MKMTKHRQLILAALSITDERYPPHSASYIYYTLEDAFNFKWHDEPFCSMKSIPNMAQIHRTLRALWQGGLIVGTRVKVSRDRENCLPSWVVHYQVAADALRYAVLIECEAVVKEVNYAKYGMNLFGAVFDMGLPAEEVKPLADKVRSLMQKTHPDKAEGFEAEFMQLKAALDLIKSGIPLPVPAHPDKGMSVNARLERDFG